MTLRPLFLASVWLLAAPGVPAAPPPAKPDVALLRACVAAAERSPAVQTESNIQIQGNGEGTDLSSQEHVRFSRLRPGVFRADVTVTGLKPRGRAQYQIIADGKQVWTFDPINGVYTVTPVADYTQSYNLGHHIAGLGLFGALLAGGAPNGDVLQALTETVVTEPGTLGGAAILDGRSCRTITFPAANDTRFRFWLAPQTHRFEQLEITENSPRIAFTMTEKETRQSFAPKLDPALFRFTPPARASRVATLRIGFLP